MARERLSNEVVAQVLTQTVENLRKDLNKQQGKMEEHRKQMELLMSQPLKVQKIDTSKIEQERGKIEDILDSGSQKIKREFQMFNIGKWTLILGVILILSGGLLLYIAGNNEKKEEIKQYEAFLNAYPSVKKGYEDWKTKTK